MKKKIIIEKTMRIAILATSFFVFWIYLGSIINFHQHHIFGRSLMPQCILAKREESIQISQELSFVLVNFTASFDHPEQLIPEPSVLLIESTSGVTDQLKQTSAIHFFHGLRAPPAA